MWNRQKKSEFNVNKWFPKVEDADRGHGWGAGGVKDKDGIQTEAAHLKWTETETWTKTDWVLLEFSYFYLYNFFFIYFVYLFIF